MYCFTNTSIHTAFSSTASASRCHSALLADSSQLTANSFQLTANSCYLLTAFLTIAADSSLALVLLSKSSKSLDHMLRKEYTVYSE